MDGRDEQKDFGWQEALPEGAVAINGRVWFQDVYGERAVFVDQVPFYCYAVKDEVENRFTAAQLVEAGLASVSEVCQAFSLSPRSFSRVRRRLQRGGVQALVKEKRGPQGRRPQTQQLAATIVRLYEQQQSVYQIASRLGLSPRTVGRVLKDRGIARRGNRKPSLPLFADTPPAGEPSELSQPPRESDGEPCSDVTDGPGEETLIARELVPPASAREAWWHTLADPDLV